MGSTWQGSVWKLRPASINPAPGSHQPSGPTTVQTDYQGCFYIISPTPLPPFTPPPDDQRGLAGRCWNVLANANQGPTVTWSHTNTKQFDPARRGGSRGNVQRRENATKDKALEWERSVLEHVIELIEINIHDWARRLGHLAARLMPTSVTVRAALPAVRAACWGVAGVACLSWVHRERDHRGASVASLLHGRSFTRTLKIWIGGSSKPSPRVWTWLGLEHSHLPAGCLWASVNGGCSTEPRQPPHSPQQLWHHTGPGLRTLMLH